MDRNAILRKLDRLERRIETLKSENKTQRNENAQLKETIKQFADAKAAGKPDFSLNYSSQRNEPPEKTKDKKQSEKNKKDKSRKKAGRKPGKIKPDQVGLIEKIFPENVEPSRCVPRREQFVWRLVDTKAIYVHYQVLAPTDAKDWAFARK